MRAVFGKLTYASLKDKAAEEIRTAILDGRLRAGERIVERNLADQFSTSLTAMREALIELEAQGWVTKQPNRGTHVIEFSPAAIRDMFAFRRLVETAAFVEAARHGTDEDIAALKKAGADLMAAARAGRTRLYLQRDLELHEIVWRMAGNEYLAMALRRAIRPFFAFTVIVIRGKSPFDLEEDAALHLACIAPIAAHDTRGTRTAFLEALESWHDAARQPAFDTSTHD